MFTKLAAGAVALPLALAVAAYSSSSSEGDTTQLMHADTFDSNLDAWVVEQQPYGRVFLENGSLVIEDQGGCTVWFKEPIEGPARIRYEARMSSQARVSDMNCFWMATDPDRPEGIFADGHGRSGAFADYDQLQLYYVGYGGNYNSTTRFRRYFGRGEKPLLEDYDRQEAEFLLKPDHWYAVELVADGEKAQYWLDGELIFEYSDPQPLTRGWFGFRTVLSRMEVRSFEVEAIR